jgi:hypothetical protein
VKVHCETEKLWEERKYIKDVGHFGDEEESGRILLSRSMCDYRRGLDWLLDLLTTYTHDLELRAITAPLLISTIEKSSQHPISLFPACCVLTSRALATALTLEILQVHAVTSSLHSLACRTSN